MKSSFLNREKNRERKIALVNLSAIDNTMTEKGLKPGNVRQTFCCAHCLSFHDNTNKTFIKQ